MSYIDINSIIVYVNQVCWFMLVKLIYWSFVVSLILRTTVKLLTVQFCSAFCYFYAWNLYIVSSNMNQDQAWKFFTPKYSKKCLAIYHQNIRGLSNNKLDELYIYSSTNSPHIICMMEHHLRENEINTIILVNYNLGVKFCRNTFHTGGVCIFTHETIQCTNINVSKFCKEKDLEICALKLHLLSYEICLNYIQVTDQRLSVFYW